MKRYDGYVVAYDEEVDEDVETHGVFVKLSDVRDMLKALVEGRRATAELRELLG